MSSRLLIIDDAPEVRLVLQLAFSRAGWDVEEACSGADGVEMAVRAPPHLILLDVHMPGLDGPATLRALRSDPVTAPIPVIFLTAPSSDREVEQLLALGAAGVVAKTSNPFQIPAQVGRVLGW